MTGDTAWRAAASTLLMPTMASGDEERDEAADPGFDNTDCESGGRERQAGDAVEGLATND